MSLPVAGVATSVGQSGLALQPAAAGGVLHTTPHIIHHPALEPLLGFLSSTLSTPPTTTRSRVHPPTGQASLRGTAPTDRLPEGQENLAAQHVEEVAGRGAVDHHPVAVVQLTDIEVGFLEVLRRGGDAQGDMQELLP